MVLEELSNRLLQGEVQPMKVALTELDILSATETH